MASYIIVQFDESEGGTVATVHSSWLTPRKTEVYWPPHKSQSVFDKALTKGESVDTNKWDLFKIKRIFSSCDNLKDARVKERLAEITSDIETTEDNSRVQRKRPVVRPLRFRIESDESNDESETESRFVRPPKIIKASDNKEDTNCQPQISECSPSPGTSFTASPCQTPVNSSSDVQESNLNLNDKGFQHKFSTYLSTKSYLNQLKRLIKSTVNPLSEIHNRLFEQSICEINIPCTMFELQFQHYNGPLVSVDHQNFQYKKVIFQNMTFTSVTHCQADCYCIIDDSVIQIQNIICKQDNQIMIIGKKFCSRSPLYTYPLDSRDLGICLVSNLCQNLSLWTVKKISKCMLLPTADPVANEWLLLPIVHSL